MDIWSIVALLQSHKAFDIFLMVKKNTKESEESKDKYHDKYTVLL